MGFSDGMVLEYEENRGVKNSSNVFGWSNKKKFIFMILM